MTFTAFVFISLSVLLHASWHFLSKSGHPSLPFFSLLSLSAFLTMLPLGLSSGIRLSELPLRVILLAWSAGLFGMIADAGMAYAYAKNDISLAYPVSRALPVLLTSLFTGLFGLGTPLGFSGWIAMPIIFSGCVLMAFSDRSDGKPFHWSKGHLAIGITAFAVTGYTILDSCGMRAMREATTGVPVLSAAALYSTIRESMIWGTLIPISLCRKNDRRQYNRTLFLKWQPYVAGFFAASAYVLILLAMTHVSNVSYVQAFRQLSLPVGMAFGVIFLKEKVNRNRLAGIVLILTGLALSIFLS